MPISFKKVIPYLLLILSLIGVVDSLFLTLKHYQSESMICPIFDGCDLVTNSSYSELFGIPISLFGIAFYLASFVISLSLIFHKHFLKPLLLKYFYFTGFLASLAFTYLQVVVIKGLCFFCVTSALTSTILLILFLLKD